MKKIYMLLILSLLLSNAFLVRSQIIYTDIDRALYIPNGYDVYMVHPSYPSASDYQIRLDTISKLIDPLPGAYQLRILPNYLLNEVMVINDTMVKALDFGDMIDENQTTWTSNSQNWMVLVHAGTANYGNWMDVTNKYIGLKMVKNSETFYGYVQMTVMSGTTQPTVTINEMAYQKTPGKGIKAGQTVGINDENPNLAKYILNNHLLQIQTLKPVQISITDISGHVLTSTEVKTNKGIDLSDYANGIYLLNITGEDGVMTKKIVLQ